MTGLSPCSSASLYGLSEALVKGTVPNAPKGSLDAPTPDPPRGSNLTARAPLPSNNARLYLANRNVSRTEMDQPMSDRSSSGSGSLSSHPNMQVVSQDINIDHRYAVPPEGKSLILILSFFILHTNYACLI